MGLSNGAKKARSYSQTVNQNQGGGSKKAGFPYQVGRGWQTSIAFNNTNVVMGKCCTLKSYQTLLFTRPVSQARGVGVDVRLPLR
jgi:hypothetical protein